MKLLGFNYKATIGEPLTQLCASAINKLGKNNNLQRGRRQINKQKQKFK